MTSAYAYVRYSSTIQGEGDSVDRQLNPLNKFAQQTGVDIKEVMIDSGVSAYRGANASKGQLKKILDRIESGSIRRGDYLVIESIDRITRQRLVQGVELLQGILKKGIRIYTTSDEKCYSYDDPTRDLETLLMISLIAQRANEESETKSKRRKSAWNKAKGKALSEGEIFNKHNPPYGLRYDEEKNSFVVHQSEADEIKSIFSNLKFMGVSGAIKTVNQFSNRRWTNRHVMIMIKTQYPLGVFMSQRRTVDGKKEFVEYINNYYPKIIDQVLFDEAIAAMKARKDRKDYGSATIGNTNIFRHVVKCGSCGESLIFEKQTNQKGKLFLYLNCFSKKELKGQCNQRFRYDLAFGLLLSLIKLRTENMRGKVFKLPLSPNAPARRSTKVIRHQIKDSSKLNEMAQKIQNFKTFGDDFGKLFAVDEAKNAELQNRLDCEVEKLADAKAQHSRLQTSMVAYKGDISPMFFKHVAETEEAILSQSKVVDDLKQQIESSKVELTLTSYNDLIEKCRTEQGRLEVNRFFKSTKIRFTFLYFAKGRELKMKVSQDGQDFVELANSYPLRNPLRGFGIEDLVSFYDVR